MEIRMLQREDAESYWRLRLEALQQHPEAFGSSYEDAVQRTMEQVRDTFPCSPGLWALGALREDGTLAGMVGFRQETGQKLKHKGMIWGMYVQSASRGTGTGRRLMEAAIAKAKELPELEQILLAVVTANTAARRLYESLGFQTYGLEQRALKLGDIYLDEMHMALFVN
ncbi:GNAT family N-acetyltransferase [Ectobacillus ponti]|uniref:GNAT family N-acetyltransferase n=1 Tax=Ectobacillus ponti TaxID=2961894 RepID=A0AA41X6U6_9BACI|nr:GNAT family N-acetyltransferase [Ectobacillus ponti]MCP8969902.1 GNAT family N-acetyltransferase [Ectobacillus ponti]